MSNDHVHPVFTTILEQCIGTARHQEIEACAFCQENKGRMHPPHFASPNCESGKRNHCSCEICF